MSSNQTDEQFPLKDIGLNFHRICRNLQQVFQDEFERRPQIVQILRRNLPGNYYPEPVLTVRRNETIQRIEFCFLFRHGLNPVQKASNVTSIPHSIQMLHQRLSLIHLLPHILLHPRPVRLAISSNTYKRHPGSPTPMSLSQAKNLCETPRIKTEKFRYRVFFFTPRLCSQQARLHPDTSPAPSPRRTCSARRSLPGKRPGASPSQPLS